MIFAYSTVETVVIVIGIIGATGAALSVAFYLLGLFVDWIRRNQ